ncbi:MAG: TetR/AcrR family transcriptional regulator [Bacteroidales bacterium]|jgi:AcrR family transcriptional regulator|nr:TetR/AcrR family transcriptional regulator [Bacteroidales bacterium]
MFTDRQQEIMEHAIDLIAEKGIQGMTMKNLSKRLGITEPAIYRHYENKIDILLSLLEYFTATTSGIFQEQFNSELKAIERIEIIFQKHFEAFVKTPALVAVIFSEEIFRNEIVLSNKVKQIMERNAASIYAIIEAGKQRGEISKSLSTQQLTTIFMGSLRLLVKKWQMNGFSFDLSTEGEELFQTLYQLINSKKD